MILILAVFGPYFWFVGRKDDLISSGGYRIGPGEIEDCLAGHSAVAVAAAQELEEGPIGSAQLFAH